MLAGLCLPRQGALKAAAASEAFCKTPGADNISGVGPGWRQRRKLCGAGLNRRPDPSARAAPQLPYPQKLCQERHLQSQFCIRNSIGVRMGSSIGAFRARAVVVVGWIVVLGLASRAAALTLESQGARR